MAWRRGRRDASSYRPRNWPDGRQVPYCPSSRGATTKVRRAPFDAHHEAIIGTAAPRVRKRDFDAFVLPDVITAPAVTHGAFCGHCPSEEGLAVSAVAAASKDIVARWRSAVEASSEEGRATVAKSYLDPQDVAALGQGCPVVALGPDVVLEAPALHCALPPLGSRQYGRMIGAPHPEPADREKTPLAGANQRPSNRRGGQQMCLRGSARPPYSTNEAWTLATRAGR
jgi:hypothetical protein